VKKEPAKEVKEAKKKIKKKVIKYVEESSSSSSSDSEEEEIIVKKKKSKDKQDKHRREEIEPNTIQAEITRQNLRKNLEDIHSASMMAMMSPSYF
jgi:hypothetical protein